MPGLHLADNEEPRQGTCWVRFVILNGARWGHKRLEGISEVVAKNTNMRTGRKKRQQWMPKMFRRQLMGPGYRFWGKQGQESGMMLRIPAGVVGSAWTTLSGGWDRQCWFHCTNGKLSLRKVEHNQVRGSVPCQWVFSPWGSNTASCPCGELLAQKLHAQASSEAELLVSGSPSIVTGLIHLSGPGS